MEGTRRTDLIGKEGTKTTVIKVIDAVEYPTGVDVRVRYQFGEEYWTSLQEVELY